MTYYLVSEENHYKIYFVKDEDSAGFNDRYNRKILVHGCNILKMLAIMDGELVTKYAFGNS